MRQTSLRLAVLLCLGVSLTASAPGQAAISPRGATAQSAKLTVAVPLPTTSAATPATVVDVKYDFAGRDEVWLDGIGAIPASGDLNYILRAKQMTFREKRGGTVLQTLQATPTGVDMDVAPALFPDTTTVDNWTKYAVQLPLNKRTQDVPSILFQLAGDPQTPVQLSLSPCRPDDDGCVVSKWERITARSAPIQIDFSVMITYKPSGTTASPATLANIYYTARQGFLGAGGNPNADPSPDTINVCRQKMKAFEDLLLKKSGN